LPARSWMWSGWSGVSSEVEEGLWMVVSEERRIGSR
jgi:hypothetical protein